MLNLPKKISLILYTRCGNTLVGWSIVNLIRQFCDEFEVIVPSKALSTGTLICLGSNSIKKLMVAMPPYCHRSIKYN
ncbi:hypothetical protein LGK95_19840 [Clostridium algoriphilum]|uniref:SDH family Clp fold serine proteinase n=1 Tax=Clostridium algoriphilum TaxID=198347 RepID=UPI001CF1C8D0|nr:hypothetical protein [Clostridium algoriphilum]